MSTKQTPPTMMPIRAFELPVEFAVYRGSDGNELKHLEPLSKINIFVGANNTGKSRCMRLLASQEDYSVLLAHVHLDAWNQGMHTALQKVRAVLHTTGIINANTIDDRVVKELQEALPASLAMGTDRYQHLRTTCEEWRHFPEIVAPTTTMNMGLGPVSETDQRKVREVIQRTGNDVLKYVARIPAHDQTTRPKRVYIPTLRGLRPFEAAAGDLYADRTSTDYFAELAPDAQPDLFTGLSFHQRLMDMLLGDNRARQAIAAYQQFLTDTLFAGQTVTLIPSQQHRVVVVKIGTEQEQPIHHLGDGIQSAIMLSFLPYVTQEPTFFFIEEPELYLHPGLQRKILNLYHTLGHMFFMTTHSNHLLDITMDITSTSIFTFRKVLEPDDTADEHIPHFLVEAVDSGDHSSLELLGVRNSSVFLVNATIWVEGITDRWYLRALLNAYMEEMQPPRRLEEDVHYAFVEYGGSNITHWSFLDYEEHPITVERLCARALVIADQDGHTKVTRQQKLAEKLGTRFISLPCREIENLLSYDVIKQVVLEYERTPDRSLPQVAYDDYKDEYLGTFIEERLLEGNVARKNGYRAGSGTLKDKVGFCQRALTKIRYTDAPKSTQSVVTDLYNFICEQNT